MKRTAYFIDFGYFTRCRGLGQRRWFRIFFASLQVGSGGWLISADGSTSIIQFQRKRVFTRLQGCRFIVNHVGQENWKSWKKIVLLLENYLMVCVFIRICYFVIAKEISQPILLPTCAYTYGISVAWFMVQCSYMQYC
jgi:hypothetical protein